MTEYLLTDHILNFFAPAGVVALLLVLPSRLLKRYLVSKTPIVQSIWAQIAIIFIVNILILTAGLVAFGNDGKMATYAALLVGSAVAQWILARGWRS